MPLSSLVLMKMELECRVMWMILLCYVLCCSLMMSNSHGIVRAAESLKSFEDLEIEQKLKQINKPVVKIIKSIHGEQYGCVDFYKQSGFDHPSMKNHTYHYKMGLMSYPKGSKIQREIISNKTFGHLWENGVGCPIGSVPILRVTKDDVLRLNMFGGNHSNHRSSWNSAIRNDRNIFAQVRTKTEGKSYNGASMNIAINTPPVKPDQFSAARLFIQIGSDESIQAGWIAGEHNCYNSECPSGIIMVREDIALGIPLDQGKEKDIDIDILKDQINGNWWLFVFGEQIGFWPSSRFKMSFGTAVNWGGEVNTPASSQSPPMGNGKFPVGNPNYDSFIRRISIVDGNYKTDNVVEDTEAVSDNTRGYKVRHTTKSWWRNTGHLIVYGGPGNV